MKPGANVVIRDNQFYLLIAGMLPEHNFMDPGVHQPGAHHPHRGGHRRDDRHHLRHLPVQGHRPRAKAQVTRGPRVLQPSEQSADGRSGGRGSHSGPGGGGEEEVQEKEAEEEEAGSAGGQCY